MITLIGVILLNLCNCSSPDKETANDRVPLGSNENMRTGVAAGHRLDSACVQLNGVMRDSIPWYVQVAINEKLKKWHTIDLTYYDGSWNSFYDDKTSLPYVVTGRLNRNASFVAVILMNAQNDIGVFAFNFVGDRFQSVHELEIFPASGLRKSEMLPVQIGLSREKIEEYRDGIIINNFERVSTFYVWNGVGYVKEDSDSE